jgi:hypothetical protein
MWMVAVRAPRGLPPRRARARTRVLPHRRLKPLPIAMHITTFFSMIIEGWGLWRLSWRTGNVIACVTSRFLPLLRFRGQTDCLVPVGGRDRGPFVPPDGLPKLSLHMPRGGAQGGEASTLLRQAVGDPIPKPVHGVDKTFGHLLRITVCRNLEDLH